MCIPLRLSEDERELLNILEEALNVSEYTDVIDIFGLTMSGRIRRMSSELQKFLNSIQGLVLAQHFDEIKKISKSRLQSGNFFQTVFEIGRRHKILNPELMRETYGKLICILQDFRRREFEKEFDVDSSSGLKTVYEVTRHKLRGDEFVRDPLLQAATNPNSECREFAVQELIKKYEEEGSSLREEKSFLPFGTLEAKSLVTQLMKHEGVKTFAYTGFTKREIELIVNSKILLH